MRHVVHSFLLISFFLFFLIPPLPAQELLQTRDMTLLDTGIVQEILAADTLLLDNGKSYRLDNIRIPANYKRLAVETLENMLLNKKLHVYSAHKNAPISDRYGVPLVHIVMDGLWVQSALVSKGQAWAFSTGSDREMVSPLKQAEAQARVKRQGFWSNPAYAVKTPDNVHEHMNSFQIVQGPVLNVTVKPDYTYINFGPDWKKDFTINVKNSARRLFDADPQSWVHKVIRIRGWIESRNGPMIELTHPEQMDILKQP